MQCPWCESLVVDPMELPESERWDEFQCPDCLGTHMLEYDATSRDYRIVKSCAPKPKPPELDPEAVKAYRERQRENIAAAMTSGPRYIRMSLPGEPTRWMIYDESY